MSKKIDGVIEAVRYKNGQLIVVRAYERRGSTFSDRVLLERSYRVRSGKSKEFLVLWIGLKREQYQGGRLKPCNVFKLTLAFKTNYYTIVFVVPQEYLLPYERSPPPCHLILLRVHSEAP